MTYVKSSLASSSALGWEAAESVTLPLQTNFTFEAVRAASSVIVAPAGTTRNDSPEGTAALMSAAVMAVAAISGTVAFTIWIAAMHPRPFCLCPTTFTEPSAVAAMTGVTR